jgi:small subunit ribosomal protein S16
VAVTIRLSRGGQKNRPSYRIVAADKQFKRDGRFLEVLGHYNPLANPPVYKLDGERVKYWVSVGARSSILVQSLIKKEVPGLIEARLENKKKKIQAARKARKTRTKSGTPKTKAARTDRKPKVAKAPKKKAEKKA